MLLIYAVITWLSFDCEQSDPKTSRPLLTVISLFTIAGLGYLLVCWQFVWKRRANSSNEIRSNEDAVDGSPISWRRELMVIFGFGIAFRLILLFSVPIQEVDLFRYIWDGTVISQGLTPTNILHKKSSCIRRKASPIIGRR